MNTLKLVDSVIKSNHKSAGFTVLELLIAAGLMVLLVSTAGAAVIHIIKGQKTAVAQSQGRTNINQAIDFIADEIRQGKSVEPYISTTQIATFASNFTLPTGVNAQPVLLIKLPQAQESVIYFVADRPANSPWSGPQLIYRWGPGIDASGQYTNLDDSSQWKINPLVDQIDNTPLDVDWSCPNGSGILSPSTGTTTGFYSCIEDGKIAQLYLKGKINLNKDEAAMYQTSTEVSTRVSPTDFNASTSTFSSEAVSSTLPAGNTCAPVDLGEATDYAMLAMSTKLSMSNSQTKIGTGTSNGNVGLGPGAVQNFSQGQIYGVFSVDPTANNTKSNNVVFHGGTEERDLSAAVAAVYAASSEAASLTPTQTFTTLNDTTTINATDTVNVISISDKIQLSGQTITINGSVNDFFVINVAGNVAMSGTSKILLSGGINPSNVLFNVGGDLSQSGDSIANGTFLVPGGKVANASANFYGAIYSPEIALSGGAGADGYQGYPFGSGSECSTITVPSLGAAQDFAILALEGGSMIVNSSTSIIGDVGYAKNVSSLTNQKVTTFNSAVYVHDSADFIYTDKNFIPSNGITIGGSANAQLEQASNDAISASEEFAQMTPNYTIGALGDGDNYTIESQGDVNVISLASLEYNDDTLTLVSRAGENDLFIINVVGNFYFSGSNIQLQGVTADHVLFNFPNSSSITINKDTSIFKGTILAPKGSVIYHNPASFDGAIYARDINLHSMFNLSKASFNP